MTKSNFVFNFSFLRELTGLSKEPLRVVRWEN